MKKTAAILLAGAMVLGVTPTVAQAAVTTRINKTVTTTSGSYVTDPYLVITEEDGDITKDFTFEVYLTGAQWGYKDNSTGDSYELDESEIVDLLEGNYTDLSGEAIPGIQITDDNDDTDMAFDFSVARLTDSIITITVTDDGTGWVEDCLPKIYIPLYSQITGDEEATVTIDSMSSTLADKTITYAYVTSGSTTATISDTVSIDSSATEIEPIILKENVAGTLTDGTLKLKLSGEFEFANTLSDPISVSFVSGSGDVDVDGSYSTIDNVSYEDDTIEIPLENLSGKIQLVISDILVSATDDVTEGDVASIYLSGCNISSDTLEVGTYVDYGVTVTAADADLPTLYAGDENEDTKTLKVTLKENVAGSWLSNRKTTFTFDSDIKIKDVVVTKNTNADVSASDFSISDDTATLSGIETTGKVTLTVYFILNVDPSFEGDIVCTVGGAALSEDTALTVANAVRQYSVESDSNEVIIDYRQTAIGDLVINEPAAGTWQKGQVLSLYVEEMNFEDGAEYEIVSGDGKVSEVSVSGGYINITIKSASAATPMSIKLSNLSLYMSRDLPAGDYRLYAVYDDEDSIGFENYDEDDEDPGFDTSEVELLDNYVTIVTAGRDQDDSTFTTTVAVTIGANTMTAGTSTIELDSPAYISNGYTMLPVRAVAEALSGSAQVTWDDATKTVVIFFGSRIIKITIGSSEMVINGTATSMLAPAEISNSRAFISLRDLGYALGLNDEKINWDDATKTATLN